MNALVEATPISGPACVYTVPSASRVAMLPTTLQMAMLARPSLRLAQRCERVGRFAGLRDDDRQFVASDDRIAIAILRAVVHFDRNLRASASIRYLPTSPACQEVPHAMIVTFCEGCERLRPGG